MSLMGFKARNHPQTVAKHGADEEALARARRGPALVRATLEHSTAVIHAHDPVTCAGEVCPLHNRSAHHMRAWRQVYRNDTGVMERICPHGVGHPDPDDPACRDDYSSVHGCDGCCAPPASVSAPPAPTTA